MFIATEPATLKNFSKIYLAALLLDIKATLSDNQGTVPLQETQYLMAGQNIDIKYPYIMFRKH